MKSILLGFMGSTEMWVILGGILLLFGGRKIPELMRGVGKGMKEFKDAKNDISKETEDKDEK